MEKLLIKFLLLIEEKLNVGLLKIVRKWASRQFAIHGDADAGSVRVKMAGEAGCVGPPPPGKLPQHGCHLGRH